MAHDRNLPCDGDGICMICKKKPAEEETLTSKTCVTPWHLTCLSSSSFTPSQTLLQAPHALQWDCPDCSSEMALVSGRSETSSSGNLIAAIRTIELDQSLTDQEKAKRRQDLLMSSSGGGGGGGGGAAAKETNPNKEKLNSTYDDVLDIFDGGLNCSFCMQLPERPVTWRTRPQWK